jgi:hypothetical protein
MTTKTFSMTNRSFASGNDYMVSDPSIRTMRDLVADIDYTANSSWKKFADFYKLPKLKFTVSQPSSKSISLIGDSVLFFIADKIVDDIFPPIVFRFQSVPIPVDTGRDGIVRFESSFISPLKIYAEDDRFLNSLMTVKLYDGSEQIVYDIIDRKWYTSIGHKRAHR